MRPFAVLALVLTGCLEAADLPFDRADAAYRPDHGDGGMAADAGALEPDLGPQFEPAVPQTYVGKVKTILTGQAATAHEIAQVVADPAALRGLIDGWMASPQHQDRMLDFFRTAFQQDHVVMEDLMASHGLGATFFVEYGHRARLQRSIEDSFPRTAWAHVQAARPFNGLITTDTYQLTTAQLVILAYLDEMAVDDAGTVTNRLAQRNAIGKDVVFDPASTATLAQSIDPASPSYMVWPDHNPACPNQVKFTAPAAEKYDWLLRHFFGFGECQSASGSSNIGTFQPTLAESDFEDYHAVRIVPASAATPNATPSFWNIPALRTTTTLTLRTRRLGFAGALAFAANWPTNAANQARVVANQMLIVGLGRSINGASTIVPFPVDATDADHASNPACQGCHAQLDPLRQFVRQSWSLSFHEQLDPGVIANPAGFAVDGVTAPGSGIGDLTNLLATHPRFALAWTQKLYFWATSRAADENDPELQRVAGVFAQSGYDWKTLVRELFSSPLVTYATPTQTTNAAGVALSIARRDQLCTALSNRLGLADVCGQRSLAPSGVQQQVAGVASIIAADTYSRGAELPSLPTQPDLFFRTSAEAVCTLIAAQAVDAPGARYQSTSASAAIADMVATVMGIAPTDARSAGAAQILTDHFQATSATTGASPTDALRSTFALACLAPSSVIVGL